MHAPHARTTCKHHMHAPHAHHTHAQAESSHTPDTQEDQGEKGAFLSTGHDACADGSGRVDRGCANGTCMQNRMEIKT